MTTPNILPAGHILVLSYGVYEEHSTHGPYRICKDLDLHAAAAAHGRSLTPDWEPGMELYWSVENHEPWHFITYLEEQGYIEELPNTWSLYIGGDEFNPYGWEKELNCRPKYRFGHHA